MNTDFINRREPTVNVGLTKIEVEERVQAGLVNRNISIKSKRTLSTILGYFLNIHIIIAILLTALVISSFNWLGLIFLSVLLVEIGFKIASLPFVLSLNKKAIQNEFIVIRDGYETPVNPNEIVLDDILLLKEKDSIPVDGVIKEGQLVIDDSDLFGSSNPQIKSVGDKVYFGTKVISGSAYVKCQEMDKETFKMQRLLKIKKTRTNKLNLWGFITSCIIACCFLFVIIAYGIMLGTKGGFSSFDSYKEAGKVLFEYSLLVIPFGMFAFITLALFVALIRTKKLNARVHNLSCLETLRRVDTICFDKTGVLTSNELEVKKTLLYGSGYTIDQIEQVISNILEANKDKDPLFKTLHSSFNYKLTKGVVSALPYNDTNKFAGATFTGGETYAIGYPIFLNIKNRLALNHRTDEYLKQGCEVVVLAKCNTPVENGTIKGEMAPIALIVLQKKIRKNISELIKELKAQNINVKIISGDDPLNTIQVATDCGVEENHHFISLKDMSKEEVEKVALEYDVFGYASLDQKELIINALKKQKHVVAMVGDGDNDVLAFATSDVSLALESGSNLACTCADIVLANDKLESIPNLIKEGNIVSYNIQRIVSLFLSRGLFAFILFALFFVTSLTFGTNFPFSISHFYLIEIVVFLGSLLLCFDHAKKPLGRNLIKDVLRKTIPASIALIISIFVYYFLMLLQQNLIFYTGIYTMDTVVTLGVITFSVMSIAVLFKCYTRFELYSLISFISIVLIFAGLSTAAIIVSYKIGVMNSILLIDFPSLTIVNYFAFGLVIIIIASFYLLVSYIIEVIKGEHLNVKSKS